MNERIRELYYECQDESQSTEQCYQKFAELLVEQCVGMCGSQADKKNISLYFGLPTEPDVKYPAAEESWSVKSQYNREYNFPK
jgi:hypothetical protein